MIQKVYDLAGKASTTKKAALINSTENEHAQKLPTRWREGLCVIYIGLALFLLVALLSYSPKDPGWSYYGPKIPVNNLVGAVGAWVADVLFQLMGMLAYFLPFMLLYRAWRYYQERDLPFEPYRLAYRAGAFLLILLSFTALTAIHSNPEAYPKSAGGIIGFETGQAMLSGFSTIGSTMLLLAGLLAGITWFTDLSWLSLLEKTGAKSRDTFYKLQTKLYAFLDQRAEKKQQEEIQMHRDKVFEKEQVKMELRKPVVIKKVAEPTKLSERVEKEKQNTLFDSTELAVAEGMGEGELPKLALLDVAQEQEGGYSQETLTALSRVLELKLRDFNIEAEVVGVQPGPVITRFEVQPAAGVRASKITNIAKDLARSLAVISVRVVEVIRGKTVIGIEIPNEKRELITLSQVLESEVFDDMNSALALGLGKDISGNPVVANLAKMPHLLVAGTTGSGKSVGVNAMIISMLFKASPEDLRMIMIDPKMLELAIYEDIPHLLTPVVTDMKDAVSALRWAVGEMERRYKLMAAMGVRNLAGCNKKIKDAELAGEPITDPLWKLQDAALMEEAPALDKMPYIVIVIDEFADMMMVVGKKCEELIARIAQKARAAGIHLILATQRPSSDVITGLIKSNMPSRMAFRVSSNIDSRVILDQTGADQLLGNGDMLYLPVGSSVPERVHGAFVSDEEVHRVCNDWRARGEADYLEEVLEGADTGIPAIDSIGKEPGDGDAEQDVLYDKAVAIVLESRRASISYVQRRLSVGYNRAARLIEAMEEAGVVSGAGTNGQREVIVPNREL